MAMQIFLDTTDLSAIKRYYNMGIVDGITTNPSLFAKSDVAREDLIPRILEYNFQSVSVEMLSESAHDMIAEAEKFIKLAKNAKFKDAITIKLPSNIEGFAACKALAPQGIKVNLTLCFSVSQAIIGAKAGAAYISPFIGRMEDYGNNGVGLLEEIIITYHNYNFDTKVLAASIRNLTHVEQAAVLGADVITVPHNILEKMMSNTLTDIGQAKFLQDANRTSKK